MENGFQTFAGNFKECCARSCTCFERDEGDPAYAAASEECDELYRRIEKELGSERILVNRFDAAKNNLLALEEESVYHQGFRDCVTLLRWIGFIG